VAIFENVSHFCMAVTGQRDVLQLFR